jgi:sec-independent protein translocase protein TatA
MPFIPNIGPGELILILIIALVVLGPGKLPDVAQSLGKSLREFRKAASDVQDAAKIDASAAPAAPAAGADPAGHAAPAAPAAPAPNTLSEQSAPNTLSAGTESGEAVAAGTSSAPDSNAR